MATLEERKDEVAKLLANGTYKLVPKAKGDQRNVDGCWKKFMTVHNAANNEALGYVQCVNETCLGILVYNAGKSTSGMNRHVCKVPSTSKAFEVSVSREDKEKCTEAVMNMCGFDLRPANVVKGAGFRAVCQAFVNLGAKYGLVSVEDILPDPTTIYRKLSSKADEIRQFIIPKVKEAIKSKTCSMTTNMWTDAFQKRSFLSITATLISNDWEIKNYTLSAAEFPDVPKTGENIMEEINLRLSEMDIPSDMLQDVTFTTDQGSNIKKALENHDRIPCVDHCINTVLRHTFDEDKFLKHELPQVYASLRCARNTAGYLKRTGLVARLSKTVLLDVESRWNSKLFLLESIDDSYDEITEILDEKKRTDLINGYDQDIVKEIIKFLKPFKEASVELEGEKYPTLHLVVPWADALEKHCTPCDSDSEVLLKLKERAGSFLQEKVIAELSPKHYAATFLSPEFKELNALGPLLKEQTHNWVRKECQAIKDSQQSAGVASATPSSSASPLPPQERQKTFFFRAWFVPPEGIRIEDEIDRYLRLPADAEVDLLKWWKNHEKQFPYLSLLAKQLFAISASSAGSERVFSREGLILNDKRNRLSSDKANDLVIIAKNGQVMETAGSSVSS